MTVHTPNARLDRAARLLIDARRDRRAIDGLPLDALPQTADEALSVQVRVLAQIGGHGGWKVGAAAADATPAASMLPAQRIYRSPAQLSAADFNFIGIEAEIAFTFARTLDRTGAHYTEREVLEAVGSVHPAIEIADSRFTRWRERSALEQLADCGNNGALIIGPPAAVVPGIDQTRVEAQVWIDDALRVAKTGGNTAGSVQRLLTWLANRCVALGTPIRSGDVVTTGSCTGLEIIPGGRVRAALQGLGEVSVTL